MIKLAIVAIGVLGICAESWAEARSDRQRLDENSTARPSTSVRPAPAPAPRPTGGARPAPAPARAGTDEQADPGIAYLEKWQPSDGIPVPCSGGPFVHAKFLRNCRMVAPSVGRLLKEQTATRLFGKNATEDSVSGYYAGCLASFDEGKDCLQPIAHPACDLLSGETATNVAGASCGAPTAVSKKQDPLRFELYLEDLARESAWLQGAWVRAMSTSWRELSASGAKTIELEAESPCLPLVEDYIKVLKLFLEKTRDLAPIDKQDCAADAFNLHGACHYLGIVKSIETLFTHAASCVQVDHASQDFEAWILGSADPALKGGVMRNILKKTDRMLVARRLELALMGGARASSLVASESQKQMTAMLKLGGGKGRKWSDGTKLPLRPGKPTHDEDTVWVANTGMGEATVEAMRMDWFGKLNDWKHCAPGHFATGLMVASNRWGLRCQQLSSEAADGIEAVVSDSGTGRHEVSDRIGSGGGFKHCHPGAAAMGFAIQRDNDWGMRCEKIVSKPVGSSKQVVSSEAIERVELQPRAGESWTWLNCPDGMAIISMSMGRSSWRIACGRMESR